MGIQHIQLASKAASSRYGLEGAAQLVNCYAEKLEDGKQAFATYSIDGLTAFATFAGEGGVRALLAIGATLYGVSGRSVVACDTTGTGRVIGGFAFDGHVTMARNRRQPEPQICIVCDGGVAIISGGRLYEVTDPDLPPPNSVVEIDGYFVFFCNDGRFFISQINDGFVIDGLDFATAEANADGGVRAAVRGRELVLLGTRSIEFWTNNGDADFPFGRVHSIDVGCLCGGSVQTVEATLYFIAHDGTVRTLNGYQPARISDHTIERLIADEPDKAGISSMSWQERGHSFYAISGSTFTAVFDATTGLWHKRQSYQVKRWRADAYALFDGRHVFGDYATGKLYLSSADATDEDGAPIVCVNQCPTVHAFPMRVRWNALYLDIIPATILTGAATDETSTSKPRMVKIMVAFSHDGGRTFGGEQIADAAIVGSRVERVRPLRRLGLVPQGGRIVRLSWMASDVRGVVAMSADTENVAA